MPWNVPTIPEQCLERVADTPELKSNPITVYPTELALLETLYPIWGTLSRVFRLSATAGSLFSYRSRSVRGWGGWRTILLRSDFL